MEPDSAWQTGTLSSVPPHTSGAPLDLTTVALQIGVFILLLLVYALTSGMKVALASIDRPGREQLARNTNPSDTRVLSLLGKAHEVLTSLVVSGTVFAFAAAAVVIALADSVAHALGAAHTVAHVGALVVLVLFFVSFGEVIPRKAAIKNPIGFARLAATPASLLHTIFRPLVRTISHAFVSESSDPADVAYSNELRAMADMGQAQGTLEPEEREMIYSIVEFTETTVKEAMVSRLDMVALSVSACMSDALELIRTSGHSRLPLFEENLDNIIGVVYGKDLLPYLALPKRVENVDWRLIARKPMFVPTGKMLDDLLKDFQSQKTHMAIVVDEYGGTAGLITLEDVLEEIVGDIMDEHDTSELPAFYRVDAQTYRFDGRIHLDDLCEVLGIRVDTDDFDFETLGGLVFHLASSVPRPGDTFAYGPLDMRVERVENQRIVQVTVRVRQQPEPVSTNGNANSHSDA